jgi:hypothetical protein
MKNLTFHELTTYIMSLGPETGYIHRSFLWYSLELQPNFELVSSNETTAASIHILYNNL